MGGEPYPGFALHIGDELIQHFHPIAMTNDLGVHGENIHGPFFIGSVKFVFPDRVHVLGVADTDVLARPAYLKQWPVVEDPFDRKLNQSGFFSVGQQSVGTVVRHHAALV